MKSYLLILSILFIFSGLNAQTGPGGIGNKDGTNDQPQNSLWLKANDLNLTDGADVNTWNDASGNNNNASAVALKVPKFIANGPNGMPVINFGTNNDNNYEMTIPDNDNLDGETAISIYVVFKRNFYEELTFTTLLQKRYPESWGLEYNNLHNFDYRITSKEDDAVIRCYGRRFIKETENYHIVHVNWEPGYFVMYSDGGFDWFTGYNGTGKNVSKAVQIAPDEKTNIAEIIIYKDYLNYAQKVIVDNYLAAKYGLNLVESDVNTQEFVITNQRTNIYSSATFIKNIIGIGKKSSPITFAPGEHTSSAAGGLGLSSSTLEDGDFIIAGHNGATVSDPFNWARYWRVDVAGSPADVKMTFDFAAAQTINPIGPSEYKLWYSANGSSFTDLGIAPVVNGASKLDFTVTNPASGFYALSKTIFTSIDNPRLNKSIDLFPNPASESVTVKNLPVGTSTIEIFNLTGNRIYSTQTNKENFLVELDNLSGGIYLLKVSNQNYSETRKLIVK